MLKYSVIIPVYNRPDEIEELLESLTHQTSKDFEVLVIEDGSSSKCDHIVEKYASALDVTYFYKENTGQGFSRNFASTKASGSWLVFFDSDCVIPEKYFENLDSLIQDQRVSAYTGPDDARQDFSAVQKAISYSMTSFLTTGGIRGSKEKVDKEVFLRGYNLTINKLVFDKIGGFAKTNMGEDMELSNRFNQAGYLSKASSELKVFHKRRNTLKSFFKQVFSFGRTRIQLKREFGIKIKIPHLFPAVFSLGMILGLMILIVFEREELLYLYAFYFAIILIHSSIIHINILVGIYSVSTSFIQLTAYGLGFLKELLKAEK